MHTKQLHLAVFNAPTPTVHFRQSTSVTASGLGSGMTEDNHSQALRSMVREAVANMTNPFTRCVLEGLLYKA